MAFEPIVLNNNEETKADLSKVDVVLWYGDEYGLFDAYLMFIDDEAVIASLVPSRDLFGKYEIDREILVFNDCDEITDLISFAEQMTAADLIRLIYKYGLNN
jgi:hypothetical protein